jgi:glycosyltransferase involved in cell wall biosynthesis
VSSDAPRLTIVIPAYNRPRELRRAVASALAQTITDLEVVVVDDASKPPLTLEADPRVRCLRLDRNVGLSAARNAGLQAARGHWVAFLDDDNLLLPHMAETSLAAIDASDLPPPLAVISAVDVIGDDGRVLDRRIPATHPRGQHFILEPLPAGRSHMSKHTLVAETALLRSLGGFDPEFRSREMSDLFLRLNPLCSIIGLTTVTYQLTRAPAPRLSRHSEALEEGFWRLIDKHRALFEAHPEAFAEALLGHARMSLVAGPRRAVLPSIARALWIAPRHTLGVVLSPRRALRLLRTWSASG